MVVFTVSTLLCLDVCASAAAVPKAPQPRQGPSGSVVIPVGATEYYYDPATVQGIYPYAGIEFVYNLVNQDHAQTLWLDLYLEPEPELTLTGGKFIIANGTQGLNSSVLDYTFGFPQDACGSFNLVVIETQDYFGEIISFQSAAPKIIIDCKSTTSRAARSPSGPITDMQERQYAGFLIDPPGGTVYTYFPSNGTVFVRYEVDTTACDGDCDAKTSYISLSLQDANNEDDGIYGPTTSIVPQLVKGNIYDECPQCDIFIEYQFAPPAGTCGLYRLVVDEFQPWGSFRSAAPLLKFDCLPE